MNQKFNLPIRIVYDDKVYTMSGGNGVVPCKRCPIDPHSVRSRQKVQWEKT